MKGSRSNEVLFSHNTTIQIHRCREKYETQTTLRCSGTKRLFTSSL